MNCINSIALINDIQTYYANVSALLKTIDSEKEVQFLTGMLTAYEQILDRLRDRTFPSPMPNNPLVL
ncbi:MAG: hypothetical protein ACYT04_57655 [Nostoc sp.]